MTRFPTNARVLALVLVAPTVFLTACGTKDKPADPNAAAKLLLVSGDAQTVVNGPAAASSPLVVRVVTADDQPVAGATVTWTKSDPTAQLSVSSSTTDSEGRAQTNWTLGESPGVQTVTATSAQVAGARVVFQGTNQVSGINGGVTLSTTPPIAFSASVTSLQDALLLAAPNPLGTVVVAPERTSQAIAASRRPLRRLLVQFKPSSVGVDAPSFGVAATRRGLAMMDDALIRHRQRGLITRSESSPVILTSRVTVADSISLDAAAATLAADPLVASVTVDEIVPMLEAHAATPYEPEGARGSSSAVTSALPTLLPNDPLLLPQFWHYNMVDAPKAWAIATGSTNVLVAVVDMGVRFDHPSIGAQFTRDGYNFVTAGDRLSAPQPLCGGGTTTLTEAGYSPDPTAPDDLFFTGACWQRNTAGDHGLHVSGTIGAVGNDGVGTTGLNWNVRIRPVRVLDITGGGSFFDIAQGILYAAGLPASDGAGGTVTAPSRAALINVSLGSSANLAVLANAVTAATNAGSLIIASAGNSQTSSNHYPASYPEVLSAVAIGPDLQLASYTNIGQTTGISAPGGGFRYGGGTAGVLSTTWNYVTGAPNYAFYQGTSMAAPHVTGIAALLLGANPGLSNAQIKARLQSTAVHLGAPGRDDRYGAGLVNAYNALANVTAPPRAVYVRITDATTGDVVRTVTVASNGSYTVPKLAPGNYYVVGGEDENGDQKIGLPGRRLGWYGPATGPATVTVTAGQTTSASFSIGTPVESKPNATMTQAHRLLVNTYVLGHVTSAEPVSLYAVPIGKAGTYVFETTGVVGSCGFGLELNTILEVFDAASTLRGTNDDTVFPTSQTCSQLSLSLTPGTYYVRVRGAGGSLGQFRLHVRDAS